MLQTAVPFAIFRAPGRTIAAVLFQHLHQLARFAGQDGLPFRCWIKCSKRSHSSRLTERRADRIIHQRR